MLQNENIASIRAPRLIPVWHDEHPRRAGSVDDDSQSDTPRHPQPKTGAVGRGADRSRAAADIPLFFGTGCIHRAALRAIAEGSIRIRRMMPSRSAVQFWRHGHHRRKERGWITREDAVARLALMLDLLERATCHQGHFPHFMNGRNGATVPFSPKDDGG